MKSRPYQKSAEDNTIGLWRSGSTSLLGVMPTGTGKTIVIAGIIRRMFPRRTLVVAHRQELIWQAKDKIKTVTGFEVDVEMGEYKSTTNGDLFKPQARVIVSTIQTLTAGGDGAGRMGKFNPDDFGLLVIDEAHHSTSSSYRKVMDYFRTNPNLKILGVTATPDRSDKEALGQIFDQVSFDYEILDAIKDGWLVPIQQQMVSIEGLEYGDIRTTAGDLNQADLEAVMMNEKNLQGIASSSIEIVGDRRGIGFASSVAHAKTLSDIFNRHQHGMSGFVHGGTDKEERRKIIFDFAQGKIQWLWNCGVFTEGFDDSGVEVIVMARPTKSRSLYAQMAGRATRPHESIAHQLNNVTIASLRRAMIARSVKPSCLIVDPVGNSGKHKLMTTADILGGNVSEQAIEAAKTSARKSGKPVMMAQSLLEEEQRLEEIKQKEQAELARKARLVGKATYKTTTIDPFALFDVKPIANTGTDKGKQFTERQREFLKKRGFDPDKMDYARGKQLIGIMMERLDKHLCSIKQAAILKRHGCEVNVNFDQASAMIDQIAKNGWSKPDNFVIPPAKDEHKPVNPPIQPNASDDDIPF